MSGKIKTIELKKSAIATYKGLGQTNAQIAKRFGITSAEVMDGLVTFEMVKGKSLKKDYKVKYVDDLTQEFDDVPEEETETAEV